MWENVPCLALTLKIETHGGPVFVVAWCCQPHRMGQGQHHNLEIDMDGWTYFNSEAPWFQTNIVGSDHSWKKSWEWCQGVVPHQGHHFNPEFDFCAHIPRDTTEFFKMLCYYNGRNHCDKWMDEIATVLLGFGSMGPFCHITLNRIF